MPAHSFTSSNMHSNDYLGSGQSSDILSCISFRLVDDAAAAKMARMRRRSPKRILTNDCARILIH